MSCDCCAHPLQHAIRAVIARYEAPIPPPTHGATIAALRDALEDFEAATPGSSGEAPLSQPRLLDLFCGAGGATKGYQRAGFYVVGVDIKPQPRYCGDGFVQADAMKKRLDGYDVIHASPPCQGYSRALKHMASPQPMLIDAVRERLVDTAGYTDALWIIENVTGAPIPNAPDLFGRKGFVLCGTAFGLRVERHRLFESNVSMPSSECHHTRHAMNPHNEAGRERIYAEFGRGDPEKLWAREMGVEWMNRHEAREAIPPAYTEWIGRELLSVLALGSRHTGDR